MNTYLWMGIGLLAVALILLFLARPDKSGEPARFLRFSAALVLFPPVVLTFLGFGVAAIIAGL